LIQSYQLKTLDAIQLSCAIEWKCDIFVSSDKQQIKAAKKYGVESAFV
jgi:predicted nucleic acid-binding protein